MIVQNCPLPLFLKLNVYDTIKFRNPESGFLRVSNLGVFYTFKRIFFKIVLKKCQIIMEISKKVAYLNSNKTKVQEQHIKILPYALALIML